MTEIFLDYELTFPERKRLQEEFPKNKFYFESRKDLPPSIEIFFGQNLPKLSEDSKLKWIHSPSSALQGFPLHLLQERSILLTTTKEQNIRPIAEFVLGAILLFAKQFFHWPHVPHEPEEFWDWPLKNSMWTLTDKVILQIGLGTAGTEILRLAESFDMKTWGIKKEGGFHPYCKKSFDLKQLHSILPAVDILSLALPFKEKKCLIGYDELMLLPLGSIVICVGNSCIDEAALTQVAATGKFRGIVLDSFQHPPPQKNSPLWKMSNAIITPQAATHPFSENRIAFMDFRKKLRLYLAGKFFSMHPLQIDASLLTNQVL